MPLATGSALLALATLLGFLQVLVGLRDRRLPYDARTDTQSALDMLALLALGLLGSAVIAGIGVAVWARRATASESYGGSWQHLGSRAVAWAAGASVLYLAPHIGQWGAWTNAVLAVGAHSMVRLLAGTLSSAVSSRGLSSREAFAATLGQASASLLGVVVFPSMGPWAIPLAAVPVLLVQQSQSLFAETRIAHAETVGAIVSAAEAGYGGLPGHSVECARIASLVARKIGLGSGETEVVEYAALLHDFARLTESPYEGEPDAVPLQENLRGVTFLQRPLAIASLIQRREVAVADADVLGQYIVLRSCAADVARRGGHDALTLRHTVASKMDPDKLWRVDAVFDALGPRQGT